MKLIFYPINKHNLGTANYFVIKELAYIPSEVDQLQEELLPGAGQYKVTFNGYLNKKDAMLVSSNPQVVLEHTLEYSSNINDLSNEVESLVISALNWADAYILDTSTASDLGELL